MALSKPAKALLFDVFGTCVDWRTTVTRALYTHAHESLNSATASLPTAVRMKATDMTLEEWGAFAQRWRTSYMEFTHSLATDPTLPWKTVDEHHFNALEDLVKSCGLEGLWTLEELRLLSLVWHQLDPWPDSSPGIAKLNKRFQTATLSNGNLTLLSDLKDHASIDFMHVLSAEMFGTYKPSPKVYLGAVDRLGLQPSECAMVAAHLDDLKAAKSCGLQTIYVERPQEEKWSSGDVDKARAEGWVDLWVPLDAEGFIAVANILGID